MESPANRYTVRVRVGIPERADAFFDLTHVDMDSEDEAIGYATQLAVECFGLPLGFLRVAVISTQPIIDC